MLLELPRAINLSRYQHSGVQSNHYVCAVVVSEFNDIWVLQLERGVLCIIDTDLGVLHLCVWVCARVRACVRVLMYACTCTFVRVRVCMCTCVLVRARMHVCVCANACVIDSRPRLSSTSTVGVKLCHR